MTVKKAIPKDLSKLVYFLNGKALPKDAEEGEFKVFGSNGVIGTYNHFNHENAVILGRVGAYCGSVAICKDKFWASDNTIVVKPVEGVDLDYIYYRLKSFPLRSFAGGAAHPLITHTILNSIKIPTLDGDTQKNVSAFLANIDKLIEINAEKIALLEESARLIYKEWFVHLRFPGHEKLKIVNGVPDGWNRGGIIGDLATVLSGYAFKSKDWQIEGNPVVKIKNITESGTVNIDVCDCVSDLIASGVQRYEVYEGDLLIAMTGATVGKVGTVPFLSRKHYLNQRVGKFLAKDENSKNFVFSFCRSNAFQVAVSNLAGGAAQPNISAKQIESIKCVTPPEILLKKYNELTKPMIVLREKLVKQNKYLMEARDLLLPRLMNGDIEL